MTGTYIVKQVRPLVSVSCPLEPESCADDRSQDDGSARNHWIRGWITIREEQRPQWYEEQSRQPTRGGEDDRERLAIDKDVALDVFEVLCLDCGEDHHSDEQLRDERIR